MEHLVDRLAQIPGVVAVTLGGSRATGDAAPDADWDFGLYYRATIDPDDVRALGWAGRVFAPGEWGEIVNGGAWLDVAGSSVDLIYRDLATVLHWSAEAEAGRFCIEREVGYVAGIATYVLTGELAIGRVLAGELPRPTYPAALRESAPPTWANLALGALRHADAYADRSDGVGCLANLTQAVLATAQGRLAARGEWALNEKRIVSRAGLTDAAGIVRSGLDLPSMVRQVRDLLGPWGQGSPWS